MQTRLARVPLFSLALCVLNSFAWRLWSSFLFLESLSLLHSTVAAPKRHCRRQSVCLSALCIFAIASCACDVRQTTKDVGRWTKDAFSIRDSVSTIQHPAFTIHHSKLWHCVWRRGLLIFMTLHPVLCCAVCVCPYPSGQRTTRIHKQNADSTGCAWPGELVGGRRQLIRLPKPILTLLAVAFN